MTAKQPTPVPEGMNRSKAPAPPRKFREGDVMHAPKNNTPRPDFPPPSTKVITIQIEIKREPKYPVYCFDMWMWFDNQNAYLDWQDRLEYGK